MFPAHEAFTVDLALDIYIMAKEAWLNSVVSNDLADIVNCSYRHYKLRQLTEETVEIAEAVQAELFKSEEDVHQISYTNSLYDLILLCTSHRNDKAINQDVGV